MAYDFPAPIEIKARFVGCDGSCGLRTGEVYELWMFNDFGKFIISRRNWEAKAIPYDTMSAVKKNWEVVGW